MDVFRIRVPEIGEPTHLRVNPLKTDRVELSVYNFQPWQALPMHSHPAGDEVFYAIEGRCLFYVENERRPIDPGHAVYVPSGARHAVLACGRGATLLSVQGPQPVTSIYGKGQEYFCPVCHLETPLVTGTRTGDLRECPRCEAVLRLAEAGEAFDARIVRTRTHSEARA